MSYAGRRVARGETFETRGDSHARLLIAIGKAEKLPRGRPPKAQPGPSEGHDQSADAGADAGADAVREAPRLYERRDMEAQ